MGTSRGRGGRPEQHGAGQGKVGLAGRLRGSQRSARPLVGTFDRGPGSTVQWALGHWGSARTAAAACLHTVSSVAWLGRLEASCGRISPAGGQVLSVRGLAGRLVPGQEGIGEGPGVVTVSATGGLEARWATARGERWTGPVGERPGWETRARPGRYRRGTGCRDGKRYRWLGSPARYGTRCSAVVLIKRVDHPPGKCLAATFPSGKSRFFRKSTFL